MAALIVGILASTAVPQYLRTVERSYWRSAQDVLRTIYAGEQVYWTVHRTFTDPDAGAWATVFMDDPNVGSGIPVTFLVTDADADGFLATAARGDGRCLSIDETKALQLSSTAGGCSAPWSLP